MVEGLSLLLFGLTGAYLAGLGLIALLAPARAARFLLGFASTHTLHLLELLVRVAVGAAFVVLAPRLSPGALFDALGWMLIGTSALLLVLPWRWHARFAARSVPIANRHMGAVGVASLIAGLFILWALLRSLSS